MSSIEDRLTSRNETDALKRKYQAARAKIEQGRKVEAGQGGALMFAAMAYGDVLETNPAFRLASHVAKLVCIAAVFIIPNLLIIRVLL